MVFPCLQRWGCFLPLGVGGALSLEGFMASLEKKGEGGRGQGDLPVSVVCLQTPSA